MTNTVSVSQENGRIEECLALATDLTEFFNEAGIKAMRDQLPAADVYVATKSETVVGFASINRDRPAVAELTWLAVKRGLSGHGIGTALLTAVCDDLIDDGTQLLEVKTLDVTAEYKPYETSRRFYENNGFLLVETIDPYPDWEPNNPCAMYVKILDRNQ